jgi:tetratricopeptide (TPR) repeat protein
MDEMVMFSNQLKDNTISRAQIDHFAARLDSLCDQDSILIANKQVEDLENSIKDALKNDKLILDWIEKEKEYQLGIIYREFKFRLLVAYQHSLQQAYRRKEVHNSPDGRYRFTFNQKVSDMLPFIQSNKKASLIKTSTLKNLLHLLPSLDTPEEKKRCYTAIDRMLTEIELSKSTFNYEPFQRGPNGIFADQIDIITYLSDQQKLISNPEIRVLAEKTLQKVKNNYNRKVDKFFKAKVRESKYLRQQFHESNSNKGTDHLNPEKNKDTIRAAAYIEKAMQATYPGQKIHYFSTAISIDPDYAPAFNNRGKIYQEIGQEENALSDFNSAVTLDSTFVFAYYNRGTLYQKMGDNRKAIRDLNRAIKLDSLFELAYIYRGLSRSNLGQYKAALKDFDKVIQLNPGNPKPYLYRGLAYTHDQQFESAIRDFNHVIKADPGDAYAYNNLGNVYRLMGRKIKAIDCYTKAIELDPNYALALNNRGICYRQKKRYNEAIKDHQKSLDISPQSAVYWYNLGCVYWEKQDWNKVIETWKKSLELNPDQPSVVQWLEQARKHAHPTPDISVR